MAQRVAIPGALGGMVVTGVARVQPAKLVRGLAEAVERLGVRIAEGTAVTALSTRARSPPPKGTVRAPIILRCTEGFTATLPGLQTRMAAAELRPDRHRTAAARGLGPRSAGMAMKSSAT